MSFRRGLAVVLVVAAAATACGRPTTSTPAQAGSAATGSVLPNVVVNDVAAGTTVNVNTLLPGRGPLLIWFWAPH